MTKKMIEWTGMTVDVPVISAGRELRSNTEQQFQTEPSLARRRGKQSKHTARRKASTRGSRRNKTTHTMSFPAYFLTSVTSTFRLAASSFLRAAPSAAPARRLPLPAPDTMSDAAFLPKIPARTCAPTHERRAYQ